jgi:peptidoglycan hydrolase-like protein with peptidoglycan-binding domain
MARSAKQAKRSGGRGYALNSGVAALGGLISRNPVFVGGSTAFLVALLYVSANALWYQPHPHPGAFFATRDFDPADWPRDDTDQGTTIHLVRPDEAAARPKGDPQVEQVQAILKELGFYDGTVDGLAGPNTGKAIEDYRRKMGLEGSASVDAELLELLGAPSTTAGIAPTPAPRESAVPKPAPREEVATAPKDMVVRIQAGLKAFGNDEMEIDGVIGARTKAAIREFQSLFGLPETGEPDQAVYAKMKEIGLTN